MLAQENFEEVHKQWLRGFCAFSLPRPYLKGAPFTTQMDHNALPWIKNLVNATGELARKQRPLFELEFGVVYRSGIWRQALQQLSSLITLRAYNTSIQDDIPELSMTVSDIIEGSDVKYDTNATFLLYENSDDKPAQSDMSTRKCLPEKAQTRTSVEDAALCWVSGWLSRQQADNHRLSAAYSSAESPNIRLVLLLRCIMRPRRKPLSLSENSIPMRSKKHSRPSIFIICLGRAV